MYEKYYPPTLDDNNGLMIDEWPTCLGLICHASRTTITKTESKRTIRWRDEVGGRVLTQIQTNAELIENHAGILQLRTVKRDDNKDHLDIALYTAREGLLVKVNKSTMSYGKYIDKNVALRECLATLVSQPIAPTAEDAATFDSLVVNGAEIALSQR